MLHFNFQTKGRHTLLSTLVFLFSFFTFQANAQLFEPNGLRIPGDWNGWTNSNPLTGPFNLTRLAPGHIYTTTFQYTQPDASRAFKFASGNSGNPWGDQWRNTNFTPNTLQPVGVSFLGTPDNNNTLSGMDQNKYYTVNFDGSNAYGTQFSNAIFMETTNAPVNITNVTQLPTSVTPSTPVAVTVTASAAPSPEEIVYVRYSTNNFSTSTSVAVTMNQAGNTQGTVNIPGQADGTIVAYYVFTSTVSPVTTNHDMYTMRSNTNGGSNYVYTVASAPPVNVVFRVNMSNTTVDPGGVKLAGNFNGFSTTANPMTPVGGGVYETTVPLAVGANITYKFVNGSSFESNLGAPCGNGSDRTYSVVGPITLQTACFGQCSNCVAPVNVRFRVNMATQTVPSGMFVAGSFNSWSTTANPMTNVSGTIWEANITLPLGTYQYKFVNSGNYEGNLGAPCGNGNDRVVNVTGATTLPLVCINSCTNCPAVVQLTFRVNMSNQTVGIEGVHVAGSFNSFSTTATPMSPIGGGVYSATISVPANSSHTYKFINGNTFGGVESVPSVCGTDDGFGGNNRNVSVTTSNRTLATICFGQCIDCSATNEWTGNAPGAGTVFNDGRNWTAGVAPSGCTNNIRIVNRPNQPTIGGNVTCGNLEVQTGSTLTINNGFTLNACGNVSGTGAISGPGTLNMNGTSARTLSGSATISNLRIDNSNGVSMAAGANVKISNTLKLQSGALTTTGAVLSFLASATNEARLLKIESGASLVGNITYNKRLAPTGGAWYFLGAPVTGQSAVTFAQKNNIFAPGSYQVGQSSSGSIFFYDRTASPNANSFGWRKPAAPSTAVPIGTGVRVFAKNTFMSGGGTFTFTGGLAPSPFNFNLDYCASGCTNGGTPNGFNLVSNPFPCTINWDASTGWTRNNVDGTLYIWNASLNNYATYNFPVGVNGGTNLIAAGQGFMVNASNGSASMVATEDVKVDNYTAGLRTATTEPSGLRIHVASNNNSDEAWIDYSAEGAQMEAKKLQNPELNLSLVNSGREFAMASLGKVVNHGIVDLQLTGNSGQTSFRFEKVGNMSAVGMYLLDNLSGQLTFIEMNTSLEFPATINDKNRFSLFFMDGITSTPVSGSKNSLTVWPNPANDYLYIGNLESKNQFMIVDLTGKTLETGTVETGNAKISIANLPKGAYQIKFSGKARPVKFVRD